MGLAFLVPLLLVAISISMNVEAKLAHKGCDIFRGEWVVDESYPYYESSQCPFIEKQFDCRKNGRPDNRFTKYKWRPAASCALPRFNAVDFLKKLKGKQLMFVGDSLSLNQWQSLTCLIHGALPKAKYTNKRIGGLSNFTFPEYDVSLLFSRNAFLIDINNETIGRVARLDSLSSSKVWGGMDYVIFDSWHWWLHSGRKQPWDWIVYGNTTVKDMNRMLAYEKALTTWAKWIDSHLDTRKTQVFFQGVSPDHEGCTGQSEPMKSPGSPHPAELVLEKVVKSMHKAVYLLNVTTVSQLRIDGHPSIYGFGGKRSVDCTHWCLSGVPDIWNEFMYALLN